MPKLVCSCGHIHDLSPIPDEGYIIVKDKDYEELLRVEKLREKEKEETLLIELDKQLNCLFERVYECPECGSLMWKRKETEEYLIYKLQS